MKGESIITMLNKLPDMSDSRHLKRRYMQIIIKLPRVKYGPEATSMLRNNKHTGIETGTTRRWFNCSLRKELIHLLLNSGMMSCSHLHINCWKLWNKGGHDLNWRWWPWTILSTNLLEVMLLHWSKNGKAYQPGKKNKDEEAVDCDTSGALTPMVPLLPSISRTGRDTTTSRLLATCMSTLVQASFAQWNGTQSVAWLCHSS